MARNILSARKVESIKEPGLYGDGAGLFLKVRVNGSKAWVFRYHLRGKRREAGLGSVADVPLATAREISEGYRKQVAIGVDPLDSKVDPVEVPTFGDLAQRYMSDHEKVWRSAIHRRQWAYSLKEQSGLWKKPVDRIDTDDVLKALRPLWSTQHESASRLRGRIERILDVAKVQGFRQGENPARWRGHLDVILPTVKRAAKGHHAAMPYQDTPAFYTRLCGLDTQGAKAFRLVLLTAARSGEVRGARWGEFDLDAALWVIPKSRMKGGREHRVPLPSAAVEILRSVPKLGEIVFPSRTGKPYSDMVFAAILRRWKVPVTTHGFRSAFRDWAAEQTSYSREVIETALAHVVGDPTERAYRRSDFFEKRRALLEDWSAYLASEAKKDSSS